MYLKLLRHSGVMTAVGSLFVHVHFERGSGGERRQELRVRKLGAATAPAATVKL